MGSAVREDHEKFHYIVAPLPELYEKLEELIASSPGPIEIDVEIRGAVNKGFSAGIEDPAELLEILRLTLGRER